MSINKKLHKAVPYADVFAQGVLVGDLFSAMETSYGCKPEVSQTLVGVTALVDPALKIEIKCIARV